MRRAVYVAVPVAIVAFLLAKRSPSSQKAEELMTNGPTAMRAVVYNTHGKAADVVTVVGDHPLPRVRDGDVLVRVADVGLNQLDCKIMAGRMSLLEGLVLAAPPAQTGVFEQVTAG